VFGINKGGAVPLALQYAFGEAVVPEIRHRAAKVRPENLKGCVTALRHRRAKKESTNLDATYLPRHA